MNKLDFYRSLSLQEREFFKVLGDKLGPCKYEGETALIGVKPLPKPKCHISWTAYET